MKLEIKKNKIFQSAKHSDKCLSIKRAIVHLLICSAIILASMQTRIVWHLFVILIAGMIVSLISKSYDIPGISWFLKNFEKPHYLKKFPGKGVLFLVAGALITLKLFPDNIAFASIAILALGDPASHLVAGSFKGKLLKKKSLSGLLLGVVFSSMAASLFVPFVYAFIAAIVALIAEVLVIKVGEDPVDDNIIIPLVAGTILYLFI
jgi:dolichol kinase